MTTPSRPRRSAPIAPPKTSPRPPRARIVWPALCLAAVMLTAACGDGFDDPAGLARAQILAVRSTPASVALGERSQLEVLVVGPTGEVNPSQIDWTIEPGDSAYIEREAAGDTYLVPADNDQLGEPDLAPDDSAASADPPEARELALDVTVTLADGDQLIARKYVFVNMDENVANPTITALTGDGVPLGDDAPLRLRPGQRATLDVDTAPLDPDQGLISWYTTTGDIELYRRTPTELVAPERSARGWLYVVYRDGLGGVAWQRSEIIVE